MRKRRVSELMNPDVVCLRPGTSVAEARRLLSERSVSGAPVVNEAGRALGVVSLSDLVRHGSQSVSASESGRFFSDVDEYSDLGGVAVDLSDTPIEKVMTPEVHSVTRETGVAIAANLMRERRIRRLLVTDKGVVVGVITAMDLLRVVEEAC